MKTCKIPIRIIFRPALSPYTYFEQFFKTYLSFYSVKNAQSLLPYVVIRKCDDKEFIDYISYEEGGFDPMTEPKVYSIRMDLYRVSLRTIGDSDDAVGYRAEICTKVRKL